MNAFLDLAERQTPSPVRARARAVETRARNRAAAERELEEQGLLLRLYGREWRRRERALLSGPHGRDVAGLLAFCRTMTLSSADALVALVERAAWARTMSSDDRHVLLRLIDVRVARLRERAGLPPFDDGLPGEPPRAFERIKTALEVR